MKLELVKEIKWDGDVFFFFLKDGQRVHDSTMYGGTVNQPEKVAQMEEKAIERLENFKGDTSIVQVVKSIEI